MLGAIVGDIIGSHYEHFPTKSTDFEFFAEHCRFTDDSVLTVAVADWCVNGGDLVNIFHDYVYRYPDAGYGATFINWALCQETKPYNSWGNGSAMRVSPVAYAATSIEQVMELAAATARVTHNHPSGVAGAQATAAAIFLARNGSTKKEIQELVADNFFYDLKRTTHEIRPDYTFDVSCAGSVPESIICFLESDSYESAIRLAISLGGDADTMACIAGAIAEAFYGDVPSDLAVKAQSYLDVSLQKTIHEFNNRFNQRQSADNAT